MSRQVFLHLDTFLVLAMKLLHLLGKNDQNDMKHDLFSHVMPSELALFCDAYCINNGTILFIR